MHEASIAHNIIEDIGKRIESGEIHGRVRTIYMSVGRLTTVVPDNLRFLFEVLAEDSVLAGASLAIEHVPVRIRCGDCGTETELKDIDFHCARCGSAGVDITAGRELMIESVEVE
jgi:hydrogenase nickel incorporation protein HypA/HybF